MAWFIENGDTISALIGALYTVARLIVVLTPTSADDEGLDKVQGHGRRLVVLLAKVVGLDIKQGVKSK